MNKKKDFIDEYIDYVKCQGGIKEAIKYNKELVSRYVLQTFKYFNKEEENKYSEIFALEYYNMLDFVQRERNKIARTLGLYDVENITFDMINNKIKCILTQNKNYYKT